MTGLDPDIRFDKHKAGIQANAYVQRFGLRLLPDLYEAYNPMPYQAAVDMEIELGIGLRFEGKGVEEKATVTSIQGDMAPSLKVGDVVVQIDPRYFRPTEVETLLGDPSKAKQKLGWTPEITVQEMCAEMVREDLEQATKAALLKKHGYKISISAE